MEQIKKYIRGNTKRGYEVIAELEKLGGKIKMEVGGNNANNIYFIDDYGGIVFVDENTFFGQLIVTHPDWEEIELPKYKYPKTYKECCDILGIGTMDNDAQGYKGDLIIHFQELIIARDAYWKIAGEEMGLDGHWKPDWNHLSDKWVLFYTSNRVWLQVAQTRHSVFAFPTEEMRDAFGNNFGPDLEICKELL